MVKNTGFLQITQDLGRVPKCPHINAFILSWFIICSNIKSFILLKNPLKNHKVTLIFVDHRVFT